MCEGPIVAFEGSMDLTLGDDVLGGLSKTYASALGEVGGGEGEDSFVARRDKFPPLGPTDVGPVEGRDLSPSSAIEQPSFRDPSLLEVLPIFSNRTPVSPSTLPLASIRHENVMIRRGRKANISNGFWGDRSAPSDGH